MAGTATEDERDGQVSDTYLEYKQEKDSIMDRRRSRKATLMTVVF